ncbi:MAG: RNA degradosome polyphosphate kinase, partial [Pygmaiobacter sp.]
VGRYLEHARIYSFGAGERQRIYIASGDFLTRNTERRVEVGVKIDDPKLVQMLNDILAMQLGDNVNTRVMRSDGTYEKVKCKEYECAIDSQMGMYHYLAETWGSFVPLTATSKIPFQKLSLYQKIKLLFS